MVDRLIRLKELVQLTGLSPSTIRRQEKLGTFPKRAKIANGRAIAWLESSINAWLKQFSQELN